MELLFNGCRVSVLQKQTILEMGVEMFAQRCDCLPPLGCTQQWLDRKCYLYFATVKKYFNIEKSEFFTLRKDPCDVNI